MKKLSTKNIAWIAMLSAIYFILSQLSATSNVFKATFESLPILVAAVTMGPIPAFITGIIGEFVHQLVAYGIDPTTPLWLLPYAIEGLVAGLVFQKSKKQSWSFIITVVVSEFLLTALMTPVIWVSSIIQGWGNWEMVALAIPTRLVGMVVRMVLFSIVLPLIDKGIEKVK